MDLWRQGRHKELIAMFDKYAKECDGEGGLHDTAMLYGLVGWDRNKQNCAEVTEYFPS